VRGRSELHTICDWADVKRFDDQGVLVRTVLLGHVSVRNAMLRPPGVFTRRKQMGRMNLIIVV
jgi:hypothetical protein